MQQNLSLSSLFGWSGIAAQVPTKIPTFDHLLKPIKNTNNKISVCYDASGSTTFNNTKSFDNKTFAEIYSEAMLKLQEELPQHDVICWSSSAELLNAEENKNFKHALENKIPFAQVIPNMNNGTEPHHILPLVKNRTTVIITDGEIGNSAIDNIQKQITTSEIGPVFLVIVPHIDSYLNLYNNAQIESTSRDNIRLSIPQAFSGRLATVIVWNHKNKNFELIPELTAPWAKNGSTLKALLSTGLPVIPTGEFVIGNNNHYESFSFDNLVDWLLNNPVDESTIQKLIDLELKDSIRQQALPQQKDKWNNCIQQIFTKMISLKVKENFMESTIPEGSSIVDIIKITRKNQIERKKIENKYKDTTGKLCEKLLIDKTVSEISNIAQARLAQTKNNVSMFQTMKNEDKLDELSSALVLGTCCLCDQQNCHVFKTISIPCKLLINLQLCKSERIVKGKKGKEQKIITVDIDHLKSLMDDSPPRFHCLDLCSDCAKTSLEKAHLNDDFEYGITNLVPQNIITNQFGQRIVTNRLGLFPFVAPDRIDNTLNPNEPQLSYSRQWLRGFISKTIGLDPASQECTKACLIFLTSMITNKENATLIFATQKSLLRGGSNDNFPNTVGRIFKPSMKPLSSDTLNLICAVHPVIEMAEIPILPESNKLLLLCLLDRQINPLITAKNQRERTLGLLYKTLNEIINKQNPVLIDKFGISEDQINIIQNFASVQNFKESNEELFNKFMASYLQNVMGMNFQQIIAKETQISKILNSTNINDTSEALNLNNDYLNKMIISSNMTKEQFLEMIPKFLNDLANNNNKDKMNIYQQYF